MKACVVVRKGNAPLSDEDKQQYNTISSFSELASDTPPAKKVENEEGNGAAEEDADSAEAEDEVDEEDVDEEEVDGDDGVDNGDS